MSTTFSIIFMSCYVFQDVSRVTMSDIANKTARLKMSCSVSRASVIIIRRSGFIAYYRYCRVILCGTPYPDSVTSAAKMSQLPMYFDQ